MKIRKTTAIFATAIMAVAFVACNGDSGAGKSPEAAGSVSDFDDSLLYALGRQQGLLLNERLSESGLPSGGAVDKEAFMAGLRNALMSDFGAPGVMKGMECGISLADQLDAYDAVGLRLDRAAVADAFAETFQCDSVPSAVLAQTTAAHDAIMARVQGVVLEKMRADRRNQEMAAERERNANILEAQDYMERRKAEAPELVITSSGLGYLPVSEGGGARPDAASRVGIVYTLSTIDGAIVDSSHGAVMDVDLSAAVMPGIREGVLLMNEGGRSVFYIPEPLGFSYRKKGVAPGCMLVADVTLEKVYSNNESGQQ